MKTVGFGIRVRQLGIDLGLADVLPGHLEIPDKVVMLSGAVRDLNNFEEVGGVLSLDVRVYRIVCKFQNLAQMRLCTYR